MEEKHVVLEKNVLIKSPLEGRPHTEASLNARDFYEKATRLNQRLPSYENVIGKDAECSYLYAKDVCKGPFLKGESAIRKNPLYAYLYCKDIIKRRWYLAEEGIMKNPHVAFVYSKNVIRERWREAEKYIKKSPTWSAAYASEVMKSRFKEAEATIAKEDDSAEDYAREVIKDDWSNWTFCQISRSTVWMYYYAKKLGFMLPSELHEKMMEKRNESFAKRYIKEFCK